jgi:hypothetical protein
MLRCALSAAAAAEPFMFDVAQAEVAYDQRGRNEA